MKFQENERRRALHFKFREHSPKTCIFEPFALFRYTLDSDIEQFLEKEGGMIETAEPVSMRKLIIEPEINLNATVNVEAAEPTVAQIGCLSSLLNDQARAPAMTPEN